MRKGAGCRVQGAGCRVQGAGCRVQGAGCRGAGRYLRFFNHEIHEKARKFFYGGVALTDEPALAKFLCAKVGFTELSRRCGYKALS